MSGIICTYKIIDGEYVGMYAKGGKYGEGMSVPAKTKESQTQPSALAKADPKAERSWWQVLLFGGKTDGAVKCSDYAPKYDGSFDDGKVPMKPPVLKPGTGTRYESGAVRVDDVIFLPVDEQGNPILPDDIFFEIQGQGRFFQETPEIVLETEGDDGKLIAGHNVQDLKLYVEMGTDSTLIDVPEMPEEGCYPGMLDATQATPEDQEHGFYCRETDENGAEIYDDFAVCPSNPNKRLKIYVAGYTLESYKYMGLEDDRDLPPQYEKVAEITENLTTVEELFLDPESGLEVPVVCGDSPNPLVINVPAEWHSDSTLYLKLRLRVIVDARQADQNANYKTLLRVSTKSQE
ncbi:MAG: hypothetical protein V3T21_05990 [Candidatus Margulisiibacteriota bacterium]